MSNTKHLADLLKVCSILPALAVMPAMAEVVTETGAFDKPVSFISKLDGVEVPKDESANGLIRVLNVTEGSYSYDEEKNFMTVAPSDDGKITAQNLFVGIQKQTSDKIAPTIEVVGDENTVLTLKSENSSVYPLLSRYAKLHIGTADNPLGEVNLEQAAEGDVAAVYVTDANQAVQGHAGNQELNIYANKVTIKSTDEAITGNEGKVTLVANDTLDIIGHVYGYNNVYGGKANMIFDINQNEGNTAKTTIVGDINAAEGSEVNIGLKGIGSSITGDILVSADGVKLPGGGINLQFGDEGTITGNITAQDLGMVKITAGDDFEINGKVFATTEGSSIDIQGSDIEIESESGNVRAEQDAVINIGTESAGKIEISSVDSEALVAYNNGILNIGGADTESVKISSVNENAIYTAYKGDFADKRNSVTNVTGKDISISTKADELGALQVASNVLDIDDANVATINVNGDNILITAPETGVYQGIAIAAMSKGVANIEGNTTIRAQNAILARGDAKVNINTSGENTVKMLGDINFNYKEKTSGSPVNANIDVTLVGADSFWKGNTVVSWDDVNPGEGKLEVSNAKITLKDGAVWNATKITDRETATQGLRQIALNDLVIDGGTVNIADTERGITIDRIVADNATFNGGMLNVNETIDITSGTTVFNSAVLGEAGVLNLAEGATLDIGTSTVDLVQLNINGTVLASVLSDSSYGSLSGTIAGNGKVQLNVGSVGSYKIFDSEADIDVTAGATYDVSQEADGTVVIATKAVEDIAADAGISTQAASAIAGLANSDSSKMQQVSLALQKVLNSGDVESLEQETEKLNPTDKPVVQSTAASVQNTVSSLAANRMSAVASVGRSGGDVDLTSVAAWAQGLYNKTKLDGQFNGYTRGIAAGMDGIINGDITVGIGYAFNNSDISLTSRDTDIDSHSVFVYGQYKPAAWYVNAMLNYTMSDYT
ncbi:MAG: autotransporter domain-containing protein, partial [Alphaproteobacteria bacterium]|nr:autotransporter domain-containing protein [Alphaproteobacteria bacterium]